MTDIQTLMVCVTLLGVAGLFYDVRRRAGVAADVHKSLLEEQKLRNEQEAITRDMIVAVDQKVAQLREDNVAEFKAMKSEFDRFKARDAIEAYNQPRGHNARPY